MNTQNEEWRAIPGYYGLYEVSSLGRVKSLARKRCDGQPIHEKLLTENSSRPYLRVSLSKDGESCMTYIHRLVAKAFLGDYTEDGLQVCHNDGDKTNNCVENLRWDTAAGNMADKVKHGTNERAKGEDSPVSKLTTNDINIIRQIRKTGMTLQYIADLYGISNGYVHKIVNGQAWAHV